MKDLRRGALILSLAACFAGGAALAQSAPPVGWLHMPPVSPEQADQFFANRTVPPSDVPPPAAAPPGQPPQALNVEPVLGHELPTDAMTPAGFPRADFAIAKPGGDKKQSPLSHKAIGEGDRSPGTAVIPEQPPTIGKP